MSDSNRDDEVYIAGERLDRSTNNPTESALPELSGQVSTQHLYMLQRKTGRNGPGTHRQVT